MHGPRRSRSRQRQTTRPRCGWRLTSPPAGAISATRTIKAGKPQEAVAYYLQALKLNPGHWPSRTNLVQALIATKQYIIARGLLLELINERPQDGALCHQLGKVHFELEEPEAAIARFEQAIALNPRDAESLYWIGGIKQRAGEIDAAKAAYAEAARIQPLIRRPAAKVPADFRVLALYAPFAGNTPTEYLFKDVAYDTDTLSLFASNQYDVEALKLDVKVVVNLISDADQADGLLPLAADLVDRIGKPTVNHPRKIAKHNARCGRGTAGGDRGLQDSESLASDRPVPIFRWQHCAPPFRPIHSGPAGRNPWRR